MLTSWNVTIRGYATKFVTGERVEFGPEFVGFIDAAGEPVLVVRRDELISVERYVEPPF